MSLGPGHLKTYLGDGAYADYDGFSVILTTSTGGNSPTNEIVLEPEVMRALLLWYQQLPARVKA